MTIDAPCPQCGTIFTVRRELVGKRTRCIRCGAAFTIAEMPKAAAVPQPAPPAKNHFPEISLPPVIARAPEAVFEPTTRAARRGASAREIFSFESDQPRFPALRMLARGYELLAALVLIFAAVMLAAFLLAVFKNPAAFLAAVLGFGLVCFWSVVVAASLLAAAQVIRLALQVEQNTRETQQACRQLADHLTSIETEP